MKKIIIIIAIIVFLTALYLFYFSQRVQGKLDEQEEYPCECCIKYDTIKK